VLLVANHSSHLDSLLLMSALPLSWRDCTFPLAARDEFFERWSLASFSAMFMNSLAVSRAGSGRHTLAAIGEGIVSDCCAMILFPEGTRSRDGKPSRFKPGVGMLIADTDVPVVPCYIEGAFAAMPPQRWLLLPRKITIHIGPPLVFSELPSRRHGWEQCAARLEAAVFSLAPEGCPRPVEKPSQHSTMVAVRCHPLPRDHNSSSH
jgi:1-acyl-sn-glycerol-3-phosphate acyltransferase